MSGTKGWTSEEALNWDDIPDGPPPPLEDGIYFATIAKAEAKETKDSKPALGLELHVTQVHGGSPGELNRKIFDTVTFTAEAAFRAKQLSKATKVDPPKSTAFGAVSEFAMGLIGSGVWIRTRKSTWQGKTNAKIDVYIPEEKLEEVVNGGSATGDSSGGNAASPAARAKRGRAAPTA